MLSYVCCSESVRSWTMFRGVAVGIGDGRQLDLRGGGVNSFLANGRKSTATDKLKISFAEGASGATATTHIIHWTRRCRKGFSERFGVSNAEDTGQILDFDREVTMRTELIWKFSQLHPAGHTRTVARILSSTNIVCILPCSVVAL